MKERNYLFCVNWESGGWYWESGGGGTVNVNTPSTGFIEQPRGKNFGKFLTFRLKLA